MHVPASERILLANELGGGWGHLRPWLPTLERLAQSHHWVGIAVNGHQREKNWGDNAIEILEAPHAPRPDFEAAHAVYSWPQLLVQRGYADVRKLKPGLDAWMAFMQRHQVDHLIADHAPLALMAAKVLGIGVTETGSGFVIPPARDPMPAFWPVRSPTKEGLRQAEDRLRASWIQLTGRPPVSLLRGHSRQVCSIAALDPYGPRTDVEYLGPLPVGQLMRLPNASDLWWHERGGEILAYLKVHTPGLKEILYALGRCGRKVLAMVPGLGVERTRGNFRVTSIAVDLPAHIRTARLFITNGGIHSTGLSVAAQVPLILVPMHAEQWLTGQRVTQRGWGTLWHPRLHLKDDLIRVLQGV